MPTRLLYVVTDTPDPPRLGRWWAEKLGWEVDFENEHETDASPAEGEHGLGLTFVPVAEPSPGRNRVRLQLAGSAAAEELADPDGNAYRVIEPAPGTGPMAAVVMDALDPPALAEFWAAASGWAVVQQADDATSLRAPDGRGPLLVLARTDQPHAVKNRVHLDVAPFKEDDQAAEVARLEALGAVRTDIGQGAAGDISWVVLADPEGNEFCVLSSR